MILLFFLLFGQEWRKFALDGRLQHRLRQRRNGTRRGSETHVGMPMAVPSSASMRMPAVCMTSCDHADQVDGKADGADGEELARVHLRRVYEALDRFEDDEDRYEAKEDAVGEARESLDAGVAVQLGVQPLSPEVPGGAMRTRR